MVMRNGSSRRLRTLFEGMRVALAVSGLLFAAGQAGAWNIEQATLEERGSDLVLVLTASGVNDAVPHDVFCMDHPFRVVVDLFGADDPAPVTGETAPATLKTFRSSLWKDDPSGRVVRYVLETNGPMDYRVQGEGSKLEVMLTPTAKTTPSGAPNATAEPKSALDSSDPHMVEAHDAVPMATTKALEKQNPVAASKLQESHAPNADTHDVPAGAAPMAEGMHAMAALPHPTPVPQDEAPMMGSADPRAEAPSPVPSGTTLMTKALLTQTGTPDPASTRPMNLDVQNAELTTVFRSIAEFGNVNIAPDRDVEGKVSIRLVATPWRQALDIVCRSASLVAIDGEGVIRVSTLRAFREEGLERESSARRQEDLLPLIAKVFTARYASAKELATAVKPGLSIRGVAEVDERTNSVIVKDIQARLDDVARLVADLDSETRQVAIVAELIDVDATASKQLGITWDVMNLHSTPERVSGSLGIEEPLTAGASGTVQIGVVRDWGTFQATLEALERDNKADIISNPKITTTNNRKARILVGKEIPLITLDERGNPVTELKKVGITLEVTPYINSDNKITMDVHPEVSDLSSQATVTGGLIFTTSQADTRVMVSNGDTAIIGGLIRTNVTEFQQGVPVLRSLPLIGSLFRSSDTRHEKRELIIRITPTIVESTASK